MVLAGALLVSLSFQAIATPLMHKWRYSRGMAIASLSYYLVFSVVSRRSSPWVSYFEGLVLVLRSLFNIILVTHRLISSHSRRPGHLKTPRRFHASLGSCAGPPFR